MSKPLIATTSLAGCFGCHMSFLDIDERILELIEWVDFNKSPINDIKTFTKKCDIGIIEGGCCNTENIHVLKTFRESCKILVSLGECAIMGGLPALRNDISVSECLEEAYLSGPTTVNTERVLPNDEELPIILDRVYPCHELVKIDHFIPGCAPNADMIWEFLISLVKGEEVKLDYEVLKYD